MLLLIWFFFKETFWSFFSLRHLGHLSYSSIETRHNNTHCSIFLDIVTKLT